ncbi:MAG: ABC transporter permease subunit [Planctomycetes bacterium]|nr:ABC transporter permease subunit [Planctomycetota bacterium]
MRRRLLPFALGVIIPAAVVVVWHAASLHSVIVPSIGRVADVLIHPFREPATLDATSLADGAAISILRVVCGFGIAALTAIPIGILVGRSRLVMDALSPTIASSMVVSPIAWMPIAILVFGLSSPASWIAGDDAWRYARLDQLRLAVIAVIALGAFFPIVLNTAAGVQGAREAHAEAARVLGASRRQVLTKVVIPSAIPSILTGLRIGGGIAWRVIIAAEIFPGTRGGLGYMIATAHQQASYEYAFAAIIVIAAIGLVLDGSLRLAAGRAGRWQAAQR